MSVLFMDSVDHYTTTVQTDEKWDAGSSISAVQAGQGRFGGAAIDLDGSFENLEFLVSDLTTIVMGGAVRMENIVDQMDQFSQLLVCDEAGVAVHISIGNNFGRVRVTRGLGNGTELEESTQQVFFSNTWHYIEAKVVLSNTVGSVFVDVDGIRIITLINQDTLNGGAGVIDRVQFRTLGTIEALWDDMYVDTDTILGDSRCDLLMPDADGNYTEFGVTQGSGTHALNVDELTPDDDTTYNEGTGAAERDTFTMENLAAITSQTIHAVQHVNWAKFDPSATNFSPRFRISGSDFAGTLVALAAAYSYFFEVWNQDPNATAAWTESVINGLESGYEEL